MYMCKQHFFSKWRLNAKNLLDNIQNLKIHINPFDDDSDSSNICQPDFRINNVHINVYIILFTYYKHVVLISARIQIKVKNSLNNFKDIMLIV